MHSPDENALDVRGATRSGNEHRRPGAQMPERLFEGRREPTLGHQSVVVRRAKAREPAPTGASGDQQRACLRHGPIHQGHPDFGLPWIVDPSDALRQVGRGILVEADRPPG